MRPMIVPYAHRINHIQQARRASRHGTRAISIPREQSAGIMRLKARGLVRSSRGRCSARIVESALVLWRGGSALSASQRKNFSLAREGESRRAAARVTASFPQRCRDVSARHWRDLREQFRAAKTGTINTHGTERCERKRVRLIDRSSNEHECGTSLARGQETKACAFYCWREHPRSQMVVS
jgi:hypothetical protein